MYTIELSETGARAYPDRDLHLERMVLHLVNVMGADVWRARKAAIVERLQSKLELMSSPREGVSIRDREDEIGWYLYQCEQTIADPTSVDSDQASRVLPYFSALGRKLDALLTVHGIDARIESLLRKEKLRDPDQGLFELLVGGTYAEEGWTVTALPEKSGSKTPDFEVRRGGQVLVVECKRFARRSDYSERERDAWLRLWGPARDWLIEQGIDKLWTIVLHEEIHLYPADFLLNAVQSYVTSGSLEPSVRDDERCRITIKEVDHAAIDDVLKDHWVKMGSSREREVITGSHRPDYGLTYSIGGNPEALGDGTTRRSWYWDSIRFVSAAYWRCDAPAAIDSKARDVLKRLAEATEQLSERVPGIVHIGVETADGDDVELVRSEKILRTVENFDPRGKNLTRVFLHFFRGESPPDQAWAVDETVQQFGVSGSPLRSGMLLGDDSVPTYRRAHWEAPRGAGEE